jgi:hypothetical protein
MHVCVMGAAPLSQLRIPDTKECERSQTKFEACGRPVSLTRLMQEGKPLWIRRLLAILTMCRAGHAV